MNSLFLPIFSSVLPICGPPPCTTIGFMPTDFINTTSRAKLDFSFSSIIALPPYNINADLVAGSIAETLDAEKLILLTNTIGLLDGEGELLTGLSAKKVDIKTRVISDMLVFGKILKKILFYLHKHSLSLIKKFF
jgi:hypothetical protein